MGATGSGSMRSSAGCRYSADISRSPHHSGNWHYCHAVVVLILARIIKSVVIGQAAVTLEWKNTPGQKHKTERGVCVFLT